MSNKMSREMLEPVVAHNKAKFSCAANISCLVLSAMPYLFSCRVLDFSACENFPVLCCEIFSGHDIYFLLVFEQPTNTCNAVSKINCFHWFLMFLVSIS